MFTLEVILNSCFLLHSVSVNNTTPNPVNQVFLRPPPWPLGPRHQPSCSMWNTTTALPGLPTHPAVANSLCSSSSDAPQSLIGTFQFTAPNSPMASSNTGVQFKILMEASMVLLWPCLFLSPWPHLLLLSLSFSMVQSHWTSWHSCNRSSHEKFARAFPSAWNALSPYPLPHMASLCGLLAKLLN